MSQLTDLIQPCRLYSQEQPEIGDLVVGEMVDVNEESGVRIDLLEYPGQTAFCILKDLTKKRRLRSLKQVAKVGQQDVFEVVAVNQDAQDNTVHIDASKRLVTQEEREKKFGEFNEARQIYSIVYQCCMELNRKQQAVFQTSRDKPPIIQPVEIYQEVIWPLDDLDEPLTPLEYFKKLVYLDHNPDPESGLTPGLEPPIPDRWGLLEKYIRKGVSRSTYRMQQKFDLVCWAQAGAEVIKKTLQQAEDQTNKTQKGHPRLKGPIQILIDAPPTYIIQCLTEDQQVGQQVIQHCHGQIENLLESQPANQIKYGLKGQPEAIEVS